MRNEEYFSDYDMDVLFTRINEFRIRSGMKPHTNTYFELRLAEIEAEKKAKIKKAEKEAEEKANKELEDLVFSNEPNMDSAIDRLGIK